MNSASPAVVGTGVGTRPLPDGMPVTVSCAEGARGRVYEGSLAYEETETDLAVLPATRTHVMLNLADPSAAFRWWRLPADGVGLARLEFIVAHQVKVHPMGLLHPERLDAQDRHVIERLTEGYLDRDSTSATGLPTASPGSPPPAGPPPSSCAPATSGPMSTPNSSVGAPSNPTRPTR